jgi:hypothetical protein
MSEVLEEILRRRGRERRSQERYTMILRVGILEHGGKNSVCLVKNISATGVQLKLYTSAPVDHVVRVCVADEEPISGRIVWINEGVAGIRFEARIDPQALLRFQQKLGTVRRRSMPRIAATGYTAVRMGGRIISSVLRDISSMGAKISTSRPLETGGVAMVRFPDLPEIRAYVRWVDDCESGLVFETPIPMQVIAEWLERRPRENA